jgi:predicted dienelactone hydrolase
MILGALLGLTLASTDYDPLAAGPYEVVEVPIAPLNAEHRESVPVRLRHPDGEGPFPLIVFSHGAGGSKEAMEPLTDLWVSRGYVVIQPTHGDTFGELTQEARRQFGQDGQLPSEVTRHWRTRPLDVSAILDNLDQLENEADVSGLIDRDKIAHGGHSFGAHTAMLLGGTEFVMGSRRLGFRDERISCSLLISPQGENGRSLRAESWSNHEIPTMSISGTEDYGVSRDEDPTDRQDPFKNMPAGDKYLVWIDGAEHNFGGITGVQWRGAGADNEKHVDIVRAATVAFFDAHLLGDGAAIRYLSTGSLERLGNLEFRSK